MKRKSIAFYIILIRNGLIALGVVYLLFFLVPILKFVAFIVLVAGLVQALFAIWSMRDWDKSWNQWLELSGNGTITLSKIGDGTEQFTLQGREAKTYLRWKTQRHAQAAFGEMVLAVIYSIVGLVTAPLNGVAFWIALAIVVLVILRLSLILIPALPNGGLHDWVFGTTIDKPQIGK